MPGFWEIRSRPLHCVLTRNNERTAFLSDPVRGRRAQLSGQDERAGTIRYGPQRPGDDAEAPEAA